jgi:hypothetical protein
MNGKPDWFLRLMLAAILLVLIAHVYVEWSKVKVAPTGRYIIHPSEHELDILDTSTGAIYILASGTKEVKVANLVELAAKQKK